MNISRIIKTLPAVAALSVTAALAIGSHSGNPGGSPGTGAQTTYEYARYCTGGSSIHDSTESFATIPGNGHVRSTTALTLTTVKNGYSVPYAFLQNPTTPQFVSLDLDALGNDNNTIAEVILSDNDGFFDGAEWDLKGNQKTSPLATTPAGYNHYRLTVANANNKGNPDNTAKLQWALVAEIPSNNSSVSVANFSLNATSGAPNVTIVTTASVDVCAYLE